MRPCSACSSRGALCVISAISDKCEQCYRFGRSCELAPPLAEIDRLGEQEEKLRQEVLEAEAKAIRSKRKLKLVRRRLRALGDRESLNIEELEMDEAAAEVMAATATSEAASASSVRLPSSPTGFSQVSFGSFGRTSPVPTGNS